MKKIHYYSKLFTSLLKDEEYLTTDVLLDAEDDEHSPLDDEDDEHSPRHAEDDEHSPRHAEDDEHSPLDAEDDEAFLNSATGEMAKWTPIPWYLYPGYLPPKAEALAEPEASPRRGERPFKAERSCVR